MFSNASSDSILALGGVQNVVSSTTPSTFPFAFQRSLRRMIGRSIRSTGSPTSVQQFGSGKRSTDGRERLQGCVSRDRIRIAVDSGQYEQVATVEKYAKGIEMLRRNGILTFGSFITGFPGETDETVQETIDFIRDTRPDYYRSQMWYCEPGTPIQNERQKYQIDGEGFVWEHATMDSMAAMDHIDRMFLEIKESVLLPQWSFDFGLFLLDGEGD